MQWSRRSYMDLADQLQTCRGNVVDHRLQATGRLPGGMEGSKWRIKVNSDNVNSDNMVTTTSSPVPWGSLAGQFCRFEEND